MRAFLLLCTLLLGGCWTLPPYDVVDYGKTADGKTYLRDTPHTWQYFIRQVEEGIELEKIGKPPTGGFSSWNEMRVRGIQNLRNLQENSEKYIAHIIEQRRKAGLPEIVFPEG